MNNKSELKKVVSEMLIDSHREMLKKLDSLLDSGAIDADNWDKENNKYLLPKTILTAILQQESTANDARGTCFEKQVKREVKNLRYFL